MFSNLFYCNRDKWQIIIDIYNMCHKSMLQILLYRSLFIYSSLYLYNAVYTTTPISLKLLSIYHDKVTPPL